MPIQMGTTRHLGRVAVDELQPRPGSHVAGTIVAAVIVRAHDQQVELPPVRTGSRRSDRTGGSAGRRASAVGPGGGLSARAAAAAEAWDSGAIAPGGRPAESRTG
jgi:hypothetical protein